MSIPTQSPDRSKAARTAKMVAITASMLGLLYGYDQVNVGVAQTFFATDLGLSEWEVTTANTGVGYGTLLGVLIGGYFINKFGRKLTTVYIAGGYGLFCLAQAVSWNFESLFVARVLLGFSIGVSIIAVPVFIAESAATARRGRMLTAYQLFCVIGQVVVYAIAIAVAAQSDKWNWRVMFAVGAIPIVFLLPMILKMPETPRWLMMKGRRPEAETNLALVDPDCDVKAILDDAAQAIAEESKGSLREFFSPPFRRAAMFLIVLGLLIQITGINAFTTYGPVFAKQLGFSTVGSFILNGLIVVISAIAVLLAMRLVDNWGRKPVMMSGFTFMVVGMILMIIAYATAGTPEIVAGGALQGGADWQLWQKAFALVGMAIAMAAFNFGVGATVWSFASESLPTRLRAYGAVTLLAADLIGNILVVQLTVAIMNARGGPFTFGLFSILAIIAIFFVKKFAPETKGRDVDAVRLFWENGGKWPDEATSVGKSA